MGCSDSAATMTGENPSPASSPQCAARPAGGDRPAHLSGSFNLVRPNEQISRNFPRFADLVNHVDRQRTPARENFGSTGARAQERGQLGLGMTQLGNRK